VAAWRGSSLVWEFRVHVRAYGRECYRQFAAKLSDSQHILASFLASLVEMVEALTIVLAAGVTRGWRSALIGMEVALVVLTVIILILGPALTQIPIAVLQLVVGTLLLVSGLQWLRKAILRASGYKALHDEEAIFHRSVLA